MEQTLNFGWVIYLVQGAEKQPIAVGSLGYVNRYLPELEQQLGEKDPQQEPCSFRVEAIGSIRELNKLLQTIQSLEEELDNEHHPPAGL